MKISSLEDPAYRDPVPHKVTTEPIRTHAKLSPSAAHRWVNCTASVAFIDELRASGQIAEDSGSIYADEGTAAHAIAAELLTTGGKKDAGIPLEAANYVAWIKAWHAKAPKQTLWVERKIELFYAPGEIGTADAVVWGKSFIFIGDLKYGVGVSVEARDNKQLAIYAESVIREIELVMEVRPDMPVILGIFQPRDRSNPEPERLWELTRAELTGFCAMIQTCADIITSKDKELVLEFVADPEKQCRFCPAKALCKTYAAYGLQVVTDDVDKLPATVLPAPNALTREQRQKVLAAEKPLKDWLDAVKEQEIADLTAGKPPLQFKLVAGKANRAWTDPAAAEKLVGNYLSKEQRCHPPEFFSVAQIEKALKGVETSSRFDNALQKLIGKPEGKPTLVPIDDKRPALQLNPTEGLQAIPSLDDV